jgi:tetratricopeptide (TPR) repeat protein
MVSLSSLAGTFRRRRTVLVLVVAGTIPACTATHSLTTRARGRRQQLSTAWARQAQQDFAAGHAARAAEEFRTAQEYARDRGEYRLPLAQALIAADRIAEAKAQLLTLWAQTPGAGIVNEELGRIAARERNVTDALRYYHGAIDGSWPLDATGRRREARTELARFLLDRGDLTQAQAELIALLGDLPPDADAIARTGALLLQAGDDSRALQVAQKALDLDAHNGRALQLAGEAAFQLGDYRNAREYLEDASGVAALDARGQQRLDTSARVIALDPFARRISTRERIRRVVRAYEVAADAVAACPQASLADVKAAMEQAKPHVTLRTLARDPDAIDDTLALVTRAETAMEAACGPAQGDALALQLIFRQRRSAS